MPLNPAKVGFANPLNRVFIGDNLPAARALRDARGECADLVYLDPPFNSKADYNFVFGREKTTTQGQTAFADTWEFTGQADDELRAFIASDFCDDAVERYLNGLRTICGETGEGGARLAYMAHLVPRLCAMRALMKPTASIYLHCDQTAGHYIRLAMDSVFGAENFRNEIVWCYGSPGRPQKWFPRKHDTILFYAKGADSRFNPDAVLVPHKRVDKRTVREGWRRDKPAEWTPEKERELAKGKMPFSWWDDIAPAYKSAGQFMGYPTQKPVALLERIVKASSNPGGLVLDPYCGCGTTIAACLNAGRQFIGMDLEGFAAQVMRARMRDQHDYELELGYPRPATLADFDALAENRAMLYYEHYAIELIPGAMPATTETKRRWTEATAAIGAGDKGIDGILPVVYEGGRKNIVVSVKAGKAPTTAWIRELRGVMARDQKFGAMGGILVTRFAPTDGMKREARAAGTFHRGGREYDRIRILPVKELMSARPRARAAYDRHKAAREPGGKARAKAEFLLNELGLPEGMVDFNARAPRQGTLAGLE